MKHQTDRSLIIHLNFHFPHLFHILFLPQFHIMWIMWKTLKNTIVIIYIFSQFSTFLLLIDDIFPLFHIFGYPQLGFPQINDVDNVENFEIIYIYRLFFHNLCGKQCL